MLQAKAWIAMGQLALQPLINAQGLVDRYIAIGMRANLPAGFVRLPCVTVLLGFVHDQDSVIVGASNVWLREPGGALGYGAVADQLHGADANPLVAQPRAHAGRNHLGDRAVPDE